MPRLLKKRKKPSAFRRTIILFLFLFVIAVGIAGWWFWQGMTSPSARFESLLMRVNGEPRRILPGETVSLHPNDMVGIDKIVTDVPLSVGVRLVAEDFDVSALRYDELRLSTLLPDREGFAHYTFRIRVSHQNRELGHVVWDVQPFAEDWLEKANRLINDELRLALLEEAARVLPEDTRIRRRLLDEYKALARWPKAIDLLERIILDEQGPGPLEELLQVYTSMGDKGGVVSVLRRLISLDPDTPARRVELAELLEEMGSTDDAIREYKALLGKLDPRDRLPIYKKLGYLHTQRGAYADAVPFYLKAAKLDQRDANLYYNLSYLYEKLDQKDKADFYLGNAVTLESGDLEGRLKLSRSLIDKGQFDKAEAYLREILKKSPDSLDALLLMAQVAETQGKKEELLSLYTRMHSLVPDNQTVIYNMGVLHYERGDLKDSAEFLAHYLTLEPEDADVHALLMDIYKRLGREELAFNEAELLVRLRPRDADLYRYMFNYLSGKEDYARIVSVMEEALKVHPDLVEFREYLAVAYLKTGEDASAEKEIRAVLKQKPGEVNLHTVLFDLYRKRHNDDMAFAEAETLVELKPDYPDSYHFIFDYLSGKGDYERIIPFLERGVRADPSSTEFREYLVVAYLKTGKEDSAVTRMEELVTVKPKDTALLLNLARLQEKLGRFPEAMEVYRRILLIAPNHEEAAESYLQLRLRGVKNDDT